jgi:hypothetical protein
MHKKFTILILLFAAAIIGIQAQSLVVKSKDGTVTFKTLTELMS